MTRLIDRIRSRRAIAEVPASWGASTTILSQTYAARDGESIQPTFRSYSEQGYARNGIVFAVILARLGLFTEAQFKFRNLADKRLFGTDALGILEEPWPDGTTGELLARMEQDVSLAGNFFAVRSGRYIARLRPDWVDILHTPDRLHPEKLGVVYWPKGRGQGGEQIYPISEVAHWAPIPDPLAAFRGMSWLTPVIREINGDDAMTDYKANFFNQNATPNSIIKYAQKLGEGSVEKIQALWAQRYGGTSGWKTAVLDQGADFQVIGSSMESIRFTDVQAAGENRIAAAGGVPGIVVGIKAGMDAATYANYAMAMRRFADITMRPQWRSACAALAKFVTVPAGAKLWFDTTDIAALREGEKERADTMQVLAGAANTLLMAGYTAESITAALTAGDLTLLQHTGLLSVQLQPPGAETGRADLSVAEAIQKVYLGVGTVVTADEARQIVNGFGGQLSIPGPAELTSEPDPPAATPATAEPDDDAGDQDDSQDSEDDGTQDIEEGRP